MSRSKTTERKGEPAEPCALVIFGATGDLAARKLVPALLNLGRGGLLPKEIAVVGVATSPMTTQAFPPRAPPPPPPPGPGGPPPPPFPGPPPARETPPPALGRPPPRPRASAARWAGGSSTSP